MAVTLIIVAVLFVFFIIMWNSLVTKRNLVDNAFSMIDTQLKKRHDLIPNLIASAKAYMKHENSTFMEVAELRSKAMEPGLAPNDRVDIENKLSSALRNIMVQVEAYPEIKASAQFDLLMRSMNEIEEQLSAARRSFNMSVTDYNTSLQTVPYVFFAGALGFTAKQLFVIPEAERENPNAANLFK